MELTGKLLNELQRRLKIGNRRGVHLNAIPANSRYKFDLNRLSYIDKNLPNNFIRSLLTEQPLKFRISWKENVPDLNSIFEEDQAQLVKITKAFENLINQTEAIESEKGLNTFGFGFPILARRDRVDNKLTVAPILIWSLRIRRTKEFNTWEIIRNDDDPIYVNEVLINHLQSDSNIEIEQIPNEMLDDGLISRQELIEICENLIKSINTTTPNDLKETFNKKLDNITAIGDKSHYEKLPLNSTNSFIDFGGLFSIFEVQKQNIINDYDNLLELEGLTIDLDDLEGHSFQPISSVETDPSQQSILHSLEATRNVLIQGPPGTGKSQTLTAILVNALENNKKTIVVCEKITALEVLEKALIERGLEHNFVVIRDVITGRKAAVDSVRERVDSSEYKRYRYNFSKESLDNVISKAKSLISSINGKHKKLDEKILGSKTWTDVVGTLLSELKSDNEFVNLNLDKSHFNYSTEEFNSLLDLIIKGQTLYNNFKPYEAFSFINQTKFIGDNPYIIEKNIKDDFDFYAKTLGGIKNLTEQTKNEYFILRNQEYEEQYAGVNTLLNEIVVKFNNYDGLIKDCNVKYKEFRRKELDHQKITLLKVINNIETIFDDNKNNRDLFNEEKINGFIFNVLKAFFKERKQTFETFHTLKENFTLLGKELNASKDFEKLSFNGSLEHQKESLTYLRSSITKIDDDFSDQINNEFEDFKLQSILDSADLNAFFKEWEQLWINNKNSEEHKSVLIEIKNELYNYSSDLQISWRNLFRRIEECKDIETKRSTTTGTLSEKRSFLPTLFTEFAQNPLKSFTLKNEFELKINNEFDKVNLLDILPQENLLISLPILKDKANSIQERIKSDSWVSFDVESKNLNDILISIDSLIRIKDEYFNHETADLFSIEFKWREFYNSLSENSRTLIDELKDKVNWRKSFLVHYFNSMLVNSANTDLPTSDNEHIELENALVGFEDEQLKFIKQFWYSKQIDATREFQERNINLSVENLYNKKSGSKFKRLSLRQIVQFDADLFSTFFPIILTSPDVASNLFKGLNGYFDIVMFDEASQLRIEDNLPAILKGKQIIIAGDEHQMPPSNYFSKVFDGTIEDEDDLEEEKEIVVDKDNILLSCESLLDFGSELNFQRKHLDFHYRSRHPFLIDFSNYAFYNQRLKPLPNNFDYIPIKYIQVNGTFSEHTNDAEAEMVLSIIDKNINRLPNGEYPTVGIATFNIAQRNLIKEKIRQRQQFSKYAEFNAKIEELELDNPKSTKSFIKNLENIQGDERDVIILSTTYGVGKDRKFSQRFGPINHSKGYKLLNVIITRAKFKVYVCSSIPEQVFMNYKDYLSTEGSNNKRAVLYAYLAYSKAVSESNNDLRLSILTTLSENTNKSASFDAFRGNDLESPFEEEVYQRLVDELGESKLIPQLKISEFRIDIVYDPKIVGVPRIAIECDGAKYHSSREAYVYDRHRQKILEDHGFVFHRIWSTNWWRNADRETTKLIEFIKKNESATYTELNDHSNTAFAFTDDVEIIENYVSGISFIDVDKDIATIQTIEKPISEQTKLFKDTIALNSKVQVKYVNNGKNITVQLVATESNERGITASDIQKIYYKSPLAESIIGHSVGDIVKVGNLDNFVEILSVKNY